MAGVAAGIARRLAIDPIIVRVGFVALSAAGGAGLALYLLGWAVMPGEGSAKAPIERIAGRGETWLAVAGAVLLALAALLLLRKWGIWFSDAVVWPLILAAAGGALIWRQSTGRRPRTRWRRAPRRWRAAACRSRCGCRRTPSAARSSAPRSWSAADWSSCGSTTRCSRRATCCSPSWSS